MEIPSFFSLFFLYYMTPMSSQPERAPSITAPSFTSDVTFSTFTRPFELQLSHLGKTRSSSISTKSETIRARPTERNITDVEHDNDQEESKLKKTLNRAQSIAKSAFLKYWFLLGLAIAILLAWQFPNVGRKGGYIRAEWSIKWGKCVYHGDIYIYLKTDDNVVILRRRCHYLSYIRSVVTYKDISPDFTSSPVAFTDTNHQSHHHSIFCIWTCIAIL